MTPTHGRQATDTRFGLYMQVLPWGWPLSTKLDARSPWDAPPERHVMSHDPKPSRRLQGRRKAAH